jgi:hypothetical protein
MLDGLAGGLAHLANRRTGRLADLLDRRTGSLADLVGRLGRLACRLPGAATGKATEGLLGDLTHLDGAADQPTTFLVVGGP